jgi:hypothetical protein
LAIELKGHAFVKQMYQDLTLVNDDGDDDDDNDNYAL